MWTPYEMRRKHPQDFDGNIILEESKPVNISGQQ